MSKTNLLKGPIVALTNDGYPGQPIEYQDTTCYISTPTTCLLWLRILDLSVLTDSGQYCLKVIYNQQWSFCAQESFPMKTISMTAGPTKAVKLQLQQKANSDNKTLEVKFWIRLHGKAAAMSM